MNNKRLMSLNCQILYHCVLYNPLLMTIFKRTKASAFQLFQGFILIHVKIFHLCSDPNEFSYNIKVL